MYRWDDQSFISSTNTQKSYNELSQWACVLYVCVHACVPCECKCGAQRATCITLILNFYNQGLSLNPHFMNLTRLASKLQGLARIFCPSNPHKSRDYRCKLLHDTCLAFIWLLVSQLQFLLLGNNDFTQSHLPSLLECLLMCVFNPALLIIGTV